MLRVGLRQVTGHVTGRMHKIPRVYRGPYGFTGQMTPGSVYWPFCPEFRFDSPTRPSHEPIDVKDWDVGASAGADYHYSSPEGPHRSGGLLHHLVGQVHANKGHWFGGQVDAER